MLSYHEALQDGVSQLENLGIENANLDAWYLFSFVCEMTRTDYLMRRQESIPQPQYEQFKELLKRRIQHEPIQYIIGEQEFMGLKFFVSPNVLIPRQDTETLVELVLEQCKGRSILDVCTGSGCIAISLAKLGEAKSVEALDISLKALEMAKQNAVRNQVEVDFLHSNMFEQVTRKYDIIVSNPPYIKSEVIPSLMPEVSHHEPHLALDGSQDGLKFYRIIAKEAKKYLTDQGRLFLEIGCEQGKDVSTFLEENGYDNIKITKDYANLDRVVSARIKN